MRTLLLCILLAGSALAETISFSPGQISASVKGVLVADQTREYIFRGQAGRQFEIEARSDRGQWLVVDVRDKHGRQVFNNFESGELSGRGLLPSDGDYTVDVSLRRPEVQREGRVDYLLTLTIHPEPAPLPISKGRGEYFVSDGAGTRPVSSVAIGLGTSGEARVDVSLDGDGFMVKGRWKEQTDEGVLIEVTEAFGKAARGQGLVVFDDELVDKGKPTHIVLRFDVPEQSTHHTLFFGDL